MPKKTRYQPKPKQKDTDFYETLGASMSYRSFEFAGPAVERTPLWVYPVWIVGSIVLGVLLGLAIKDFQTVKDTLARPGTVAKINDPQYATATSGLQLSKTSSQVIQGNASSLQGTNQALQPGQEIMSFQNGFSGYGQQGSVGTSAAHQ